MLDTDRQLEKKGITPPPYTPTPPPRETPLPPSTTSLYPVLQVTEGQVYVEPTAPRNVSSEYMDTTTAASCSGTERYRLQTSFEHESKGLRERPQVVTSSPLSDSNPFAHRTEREQAKSEEESREEQMVGLLEKEVAKLKDELEEHKHYQAEEKKKWLELARREERRQGQGMVMQEQDMMTFDLSGTWQDTEKKGEVRGKVSGRWQNEEERAESVQRSEERDEEVLSRVEAAVNLTGRVLEQLCAKQQEELVHSAAKRAVERQGGYSLRSRTTQPIQGNFPLMTSSSGNYKYKP